MQPQRCELAGGLSGGGVGWWPLGAWRRELGAADGRVPRGWQWEGAGGRRQVQVRGRWQCRRSAVLSWGRMRSNRGLEQKGAGRQQPPQREGGCRRRCVQEGGLSQPRLASEEPEGVGSIEL